MKAARASVNVPVRTQPYGIGWCVPASAQMILAFYGENVDLARIAKDMHASKKEGVDFFHAAMYFLSRGYGVRLVLWHTDFPVSFVSIRGNVPERRVMAWANRKVKSPSLLRFDFRRFGREFFARGGEIEARAITIGMLRSALRRRQPPIVIVNVTTMWRAPREYALHAVVPVAIGDKRIVINDPSPSEKRSAYSIDVFLHALYRCDGVALLIKPRRR